MEIERRESKVVMKRRRVILDIVTLLEKGIKNSKSKVIHVDIDETKL